eukprot:TRINITY_DN76691_c0_g1_i1.p1 TRINITY_DN76691_c0_g1~~TRINITY_DN76691_c0_g1_i1.p1  ORF type:complete len:483 (+),score=42.80 TRINITY_DN76691_c0_g1_i1:454-1902(+)
MKCHPTAKWEHRTAAVRVYSGDKLVKRKEVLAIAGGHFISSKLVLGRNMSSHVSNSDNRLVFETTLAGVDAFPWPMRCDIICNCDVNSSFRKARVIENGCPVNQALMDLRVHAIEPGRLAFSFIPLSFGDSDRFRLQCLTTAFPRATSVAEQCTLMRGKENKQPPPLKDKKRNLRMNRNTEIFSDVGNSIQYDNWSVFWARNQQDRETYVRVGNDKGYFGAAIGVPDQSAAVHTGWGNFALASSVEVTDMEAGVGIAYGAYGVRVDNDLDDYQTAVEVVAGAVEVDTVVDMLDRDYGQRVKVRNTEIAFRHDFFDVQDPDVDDDVELATEIVVSHKSSIVALGFDVDDSEYGVSVGKNDKQFALLRDFDERQTHFQGNWGDNWQLVLNGDFPDFQSTEVFTQVGFGKLGNAYVEVGAGVGGDGIPQGMAEIETEDLGLAMNFVDDDGDRVLLYSISIGKFSYVWESWIILDNIRVPLVVEPT